MWLDKIRTFDGKVAIRKVVFLFSICVVLIWTSGAQGQQDADSYRAAIRGSGDSQFIPALLDFLLLAGVLACFVISVKVKSFLRDGELASGWSLFSLSFILLFAAQVLSLSTNMGFMSISVSIISVLRLLFVVSLASGIYFMKKVLS
jgi:hypothetical protein